MRSKRVEYIEVNRRRKRDENNQNIQTTIIE